MRNGERAEAVVMAAHGNATMTESPLGETLVRALAEIAAQAKVTARVASELAVKEAMTWDFFRWVVVVLLAANFLASLLLYSGIRSEIAALKQDREASASQLADLRAEVDEKIKKAKAELNGDLAAAHSGLLKELRKANAAPNRSAPTPTPTPTPTQSAPLPTRTPNR
jgi:hypothetical protein